MSLVKTVLFQGTVCSINHMKFVSDNHLSSLSTFPAPAHGSKQKKGSYLPHVLGIRPNVLFQNEELIPDPASLGTMMRVLVAVGQFGLVVGERGAGWRRGPIAPLEHT